MANNENNLKSRFKVSALQLNKKTFLGLLALLMGVGVVVISSFFPVIIDPEQLNNTTFWSNEVLTMAIVILGMVSALFIGQSSNAADPLSEVAKARLKFDKSVVRITNVSAFHQWVKTVFQPKDIKAIEERTLREIGIKQLDIYELELNEIRTLVNKPQKINGKFYGSITKEQFNIIYDLKTGKNKIKLVEPQYYLTCSTILSDLTITEKSSKEGAKKVAMVGASFVWKLLMTVAVAMVFTSLVYDVANEIPIAKSLMNFFSRMVSLASSVFLGYRVGCDENDIDADFINMRILVHDQYIQDTHFVAKTVEELAKEEFKERVAQENKDYMEGKMPKEENIKGLKGEKYLKPVAQIEEKSHVDIIL